jgi:hypothetical protein
MWHVPCGDVDAAGYTSLGIRATKLAAGLAMYISCFPETVKAGVPDDLKHPSHHKHKDILTVSLTERVVVGHGSPSAHPGAGHPRLLESERFTKKRFQVVFAKATFVKGKACALPGGKR